MAAQEYRRKVQAYWEETTELYLQHGTTFQGGLLGQELGTSSNSYANNVALASRAGIGPGSRVLDAGCGVCGPSIDIARYIADIMIDAVTISPSQASYARNAVEHARLSEKISVHVCDYHELPFPPDAFDVVLFFESLYTTDLCALLSEVGRVLAPGGVVYAKEVFRAERSLCVEERAALAEFESLFSYHVRPMSDLIAALRSTGFEEIESKDLSSLVSSYHYEEAMVETLFGFTIPSEFGRRHYRQHGPVPLLFGEVRARKPL